MTMIVRSEEPIDWLNRKNGLAQTYLAQAMDGWVKFCIEALEIQASKLWKMTSTTWKGYCRTTWNLDSSRIRQYKGSLPYAQKLLEVSQDISVQESDMRKLKTVVQADDPLMAQTYEIATEIAQNEGFTVQASTFRHTYDVLTLAEATGFVDIGGEVSVPADFEDSTQLAILQSIDEAKKRKTQRAIETKQKIKVVASKVGDTYKLATFDGRELPDSFHFTFWAENPFDPQSKAGENDWKN